MGISEITPFELELVDRDHPVGRISAEGSHSEGQFQFTPANDNALTYHGNRYVSDIWQETNNGLRRDIVRMKRLELTLLLSPQYAASRATRDPGTDLCHQLGCYHPLST